MDLGDENALDLNPVENGAHLMDVDHDDDIDFDDRKVDFETNFHLKCTNVQRKPGEATVYEFRLTAEENRRIKTSRDYFVQTTESRFPYALEDFGLWTGEYLDIIPSGKSNVEEFVRRAIRTYFDTDENDEDGDARDRIVVTGPGVKKIKGNIYFISSETEFFRINKTESEGSGFLTKIEEADADFKIVFKGDPIRFGVMEDGKIRRYLPEGFNQTVDGYYEGPVAPDPELHFEVNEKEALRLLFELFKLIETVKDEESKTSMVQFFLQFNKAMLYDVLKINHKIAILFSHINNAGKSMFMKLMSIINFGYKIQMQRGFTEAFVTDTLSQPNRIVLIDELTKTDPVDETAKSQWNRSFKGKADAKAKNRKNDVPIPRSTLAMATNKSPVEFAAFHKIEKSTRDKLEFNFLGHRSVYQNNPDHFKECLDRAEDVANDMFRYSPIYLAYVHAACHERVSSAEIRQMSQFAANMGERLAESLAHLYRLCKLLREKSDYYGLRLPICLREFDPRCLTEALFNEEKVFKDLFQLLVDRFAVHFLRDIQGSQDLRLNHVDLENTIWLPSWAKKTYEKMVRCQKKVGLKYYRFIRITKDVVGVDLFKRAHKLISVNVDKKAEEVLALTKRKNEEKEAESLEELNQIVVAPRKEVFAPRKEVVAPRKDFEIAKKRQRLASDSSVSSEELNSNKETSDNIRREEGIDNLALAIEFTDDSLTTPPSGDPSPSLASFSFTETLTFSSEKQSPSSQPWLNSKNLKRKSNQMLNFRNNPTEEMSKDSENVADDFGVSGDEIYTVATQPRLSESNESTQTKEKTGTPIIATNTIHAVVPPNSSKSNGAPTVPSKSSQGKNATCIKAAQPKLSESKASSLPKQKTSLQIVAKDKLQTKNRKIVSSNGPPTSQTELIPSKTATCNGTPTPQIEVIPVETATYNGTPTPQIELIQGKIDASRNKLAPLSSCSNLSQNRKRVKSAAQQKTGCLEFQSIRSSTKWSCGVSSCKESNTKENPPQTEFVDSGEDLDSSSMQFGSLQINKKKQPVRRSNRKTVGQLVKEKNERIIIQLRKDSDEGIGLRIDTFPIKGRGIVTTKARRKNDFVLEYKGELINKKGANQREAKYSMDITNGCYMYYFKHGVEQYCIDATRESGRMGRLLNHSCKNPNLIPKVMLVDGSPRLYLVAKTDIEAETELVYDYGERNKAIIQAHPWLAQ